MLIKTDLNTCINIVKNEQDFTLIFAKPRHGKTLAMETIIEEYHRRGYVVIVLSDAKDEFEMMYAMFLPRKRYHVEHLRKIGKPMEKKDVKIYHPFTFDVPKNKPLPDINFYGFSLKELKRNEWSMLSESEFESETTRLLLNATSNLKNNEGLYAFLHNIEESVFGKRDKKSLKPDPKHFYLRVTSATAKGLQEVASYLLPFKRHYFLVSEDSPLKLNWKDIFKDNQHYHCFTTSWIEDEKLKEFCILALFNSIIRTVVRLKDQLKKSILIVIPEIRYLVPLRPEGYRKFLASGIRDNVTRMRNMGRGISFVADSQAWSDIDEAVKKTGTFVLYGELTDSDIEKLSKANKYKREVSDQLRNMPYKNSYFVFGKESEGTFTTYFPGHCHAEPEYNFFEMYKRECREKMKTYNELIDKMEKELKGDEEKFKEKVKRREKEEKEKLQKQKSEKKEKVKDGEEIKKKSDKIKKLEDEKTKNLKERCFELKRENPDISKREIGRRVGISHQTVSKYLKDFEEEDEEEDVDLEEKTPELGEDFELPEE